MSDSEAVRSVGPYSPVRTVGPWVITSGQIGILTGPDGIPALVPGGTSAELRQALSNLRQLLEAEGATVADVVKTTVFLTDMADYAEMNTVWMEIFSGVPPTRSAVAVSALPLGARIEVEAWAYLGNADA